MALRRGGYDLNDHSLLLRSGKEPALRTQLHAFERTWERGDYWALVVLPPDRLPATQDERRIVEAAAGLERATRLTEAATAYRTVLARWPENFTARMGLGNTLYARKDFTGAADAFRAATATRPEAASALNNLAYALAEQGKRSETRSAVEQAIRVASADEAESYRASLWEIAGEQPAAN